MSSAATPSRTCRTLVLTPSRSGPDLIHAPLAQTDERQQAEHCAAGRREAATALQVPAGKLRVFRQTVDLRLIHEEIERIETTERAFRVVAVQPGALLALGFELHQTLVRPLAQLGDRPELDRIGGARLGAGG